MTYKGSVLKTPGKDPDITLSKTNESYNMCMYRFLRFYFSSWNAERNLIEERNKKVQKKKKKGNHIKECTKFITNKSGVHPLFFTLSGVNVKTARREKTEQKIEIT